MFPSSTDAVAAVRAYRDVAAVQDAVERVNRLFDSGHRSVIAALELVKLERELLSRAPGGALHDLLADVDGLEDQEVVDQLSTARDCANLLRVEVDAELAVREAEMLAALASASPR